MCDFVKICISGDLVRAKEVHDSYECFYDRHTAYIESCKYGHIEMAKWLYEIWDVC